MDESLSPEAIDAAASLAGLPLTPAWRDDLVAHSRAILDNKRRVRPARPMAAEPAHIFTTPAAPGRQG